MAGPIPIPPTTEQQPEQYDVQHATFQPTSAAGLRDPIEPIVRPTSPPKPTTNGATGASATAISGATGIKYGESILSPENEYFESFENFTRETYPRIPSQ